MTQFTAIGLGEILWDVLPDGRKRGAPANFAYHINGLGGVGFPVSRIGDDALGRETLAVLGKHRVATDHISIDPVYPTGTVDAAIDAHGVATYTFPDDVAWDHLSFDESTYRLAATVDAICFGTLAQRSPFSQASIHQLLAHAPQALKIYDVNLRQTFYSPDRILASLEVADVLKINDEELVIVSKMFGLPDGEQAALSHLLVQHDLVMAVLTRGGDGSLILSGADVAELAGQPTEVVDTIGAGDSFTAAMALAYLYCMSLDEIIRYATRVAAYVCGQSGAMPVMPSEFRIG